MQCPLLESVDFHGCVALTNLGGTHTFCNDNALKSVNLEGCLSLIKFNESIFADCSALDSLNITGCTSLESFDKNALIRCKALESITGWNDVKATIKYFKESSFEDCIALNVDLSNLPNVISFDKQCFYRDVTLDSTMEECPSLVTIGQSAFNGCTSLGDIDLHGNTSLTTINTSAFQNAKAVHVNLNNCSALTTIGNSAWKGAKTEEFYMNDCTRLTTIGGDNTNGVWANATDLRIFEAERCTALTSLNKNAFSSCNSLKKCTFKGCTSMESILTGALRNSGGGDYDFSDCTSLATLDNIIGGNSYNAGGACNTILFKNCPITTIADNCFCRIIYKQITIHDLTEDTTYNTYVDFSNCTSLTTLGNNVFLNTSADYIDFSNCTSLESIGSSCFNSSECRYLNFDGTNNITSIATSAFANTGNTTKGAIVKYGEFIEPKLGTLATRAFENCRIVKSFDASGAPLTTIGSRAFCKASNLETVSFANCDQLEKTANGGDATFYQCNNLTSADFTGCEKLSQIDKDTFFECKNVVITGAEDWPVETIGQAAFNMCQAQPTLKFTNSKLTTVNNQAFRGCNSCSEIELHFDPDAETAVYHQAFTSCGSNVGGCNIKLYCGNTMPQVTPIGADQTTGNAGATWRISFDTNSGTTFHFPAAAEANAKSTAQLLEDDTKSKRNGSGSTATTVDGNIAWWCCSNGGLTTTTGGSDGAQEARVNLWYTGTPTLAFDL